MVFCVQTEACVFLNPSVDFNSSTVGLVFPLQVAEGSAVQSPACSVDGAHGPDCGLCGHSDLWSRLAVQVTIKFTQYLDVS